MNMPKASHHDEPFSRLLSKDASKPNSSCRVYYGEAAGAVPFVWESQPGTPKHKLFESSSLPPLTPPPSYSASGRIAVAKSASGKPKFDLLVSAIFAKSRSGARARRLSQPSSVFSLSSLSTSSSSSSASWSNGSGNSRVSRNVAMLDDDDDRDSGDSPRSGSSPTSTLCFPGMKKTARRLVAGCYAPASEKNGRVDDH